MVDGTPDGHSARPAFSPGLVPVLAGAVVLAVALLRSVGPDDFDPRDFFIYRLGAELALRGETPYDVPKVQQHVAAKFPDKNPDEESLSVNCGFFLPPLAVLLYIPFALLPWNAAEIAWAIVNGLGAYFMARLPLLLRPRDPPPPGLLLWAVAPFLLAVNPLTLVVPFPVGQTSVVTVGCVAAGLWAFGRGRPYLGAMLWVVPFIKPHLALPLIPLAWYLGGWRPAALLVLVVGIANAAGATLIGGSPLYLRDYFAYLPETRNAVRYNQVALNASIASWNRLLFAAGGPLIELSALTTAAGYLVWFGLVIGRVALAGVRPSASWAAAVAAVGGVLCAQVLVYELLLLAVVAPYVRDLFGAGYRLRAWGVMVLMGCHLIPQKLMADFGVGAHHPLGVALVAVLVLTGPVAPLPQRGNRE